MIWLHIYEAGARNGVFRNLQGRWRDTRFDNWARFDGVWFAPIGFETEEVIDCPSEEEAFLAWLGASGTKFEILGIDKTNWPS